jgi:Zn-dependent M28 family amino/carboxypeptidase
LRRNPSQGAVDNGAACAILLGLAQHIADGNIPLEGTRLTLALFGGEEVNMQGSRAYTLGRKWTLPSAALNLEIMAQDGEYVFWEQDGMSLKLFRTDLRLNLAISEAVEKVTGNPARPAGPINSDGYSFMRARVPVATLGTYDCELRESGLHLPSDNLSRVKMTKLVEGVEILAQFIRSYRSDL